MNIFTYINDILYKKTGRLLDKKEEEADFQSYMIQRWLSMYSDGMSKLLNGTINLVYRGIDNKDDWYKLFLVIIPKSKFKKFRYIKKISAKSKQVNEDLENVIELVSNSKEISKREVRMYIEEYGLDVKNIKNSLKKCQ